MNWGWKITVGYLAFVILILALVYKTTGVEFELVTEDYYSQELAFQGKIDKQKMSRKRGHDIDVVLEQDGVALKFNNFSPDAETSGKVSFFRPSDSRLDREFDWEMNDKGMMYLDDENFRRGQYTFKLDGEMNGEPFYIEKPVFIP